MLNRAVGFFLRNTAGFLGGKSGRESRGVKNGGEEPGYLREWSHVLRRSKQPRGFVKSTHEIWRTLETSIGNSSCVMENSRLSLTGGRQSSESLNQAVEQGKRDTRAKTPTRAGFFILEEETWKIEYTGRE